jgi:hypothetical protein
LISSDFKDFLEETQWEFLHINNHLPLHRNDVTTAGKMRFTNWSKSFQSNMTRAASGFFTAASAAIKFCARRFVHSRGWNIAGLRAQIKSAATEPEF